MVDLGQKKVEFYSAFFYGVISGNCKKRPPVGGLFQLYKINYFAFAYRLETSFQSITLKNASI